MKCIYCKNKETSVKNSRKTNAGMYIWRRRECKQCEAIFTTKESPLADNIFIIKRNGKRQRFVYEKLLVSVIYALEGGKNRDHGTEALFAKRISRLVIEDILKFGKKDITTEFLIVSIYTHLQKISTFGADRYMYYSEYRLGICSRLKFTKKYRNYFSENNFF